MAYATDTELAAKYPALSEFYDTAGAETVLTAALQDANISVATVLSDVLSTIEADTGGTYEVTGLIKLKTLEMMLAYEAISVRPDVGVSSNLRENGKQEGDRAREIMEKMAKVYAGSGSLHVRRITTGPSFTSDVPESWDIDPTDTDT